GIVTAASIVFAFLTGWPSIIAVILNYVKRSEARGTWLESHFRWQIRTFWGGLLWVALCLAFVVLTLGVGLLIAWLPLMVVGFWFIYRIAKGWLRLVDGRPLDVGPPWGQRGGLEPCGRRARRSSGCARSVWRCRKRRRKSRGASRRGACGASSSPSSTIIITGPSTWPCGCRRPSASKRR